MDAKKSAAIPLVTQGTKARLRGTTLIFAEEQTLSWQITAPAVAAY